MWSLKSFYLNNHNLIYWIIIIIIIINIDIIMIKVTQISKRSGEKWSIFVVNIWSCELGSLWKPFKSITPWKNASSIKSLTYFCGFACTKVYGKTMLKIPKYFPEPHLFLLWKFFKYMDDFPCLLPVWLMLDWEGEWTRNLRNNI